MVARPSLHGNHPPEYSPEDIEAELQRLEAKLDRADALVAELLRPEPVDWKRYYTELLTEAAEAGRRRAARMEGGA